MPFKSLVGSPFVPLFCISCLYLMCLVLLCQNLFITAARFCSTNTLTKGVGMGPKPAAMKAMKTMKSILKKTAPKAKATLTKGSKATLTKGGSGAKAKAMKATKTKLNKSQLDKLGKLTLAQKVAKAAEGAETAEEAATNLKELLGKQEHSKVWSKHQTWLKGQNKKTQNEFGKLSKNEKGQAAALHLIKASAPKFMTSKESLSQVASFDKREKWESELQMIERFGETEFWQHVNSGRIIWRDDPFTYGVYNYCDRGDVTKNTHVQKKRQWEKGQEYQPTQEDEDEFEGLWYMDSIGHISQVEGWGSKGKGNALTKGKGQGKKGGKGKGKGALTKGKGGGELLALTNGEDAEGQEDEGQEQKTEEEQWAELLVKAKRGRDQCSSALADCEAAMEGAERAKRLTKTARKEVESMLKNLSNKQEELKLLLAKKEKYLKLEKAKKLLVQAGTLLKEVKEETKELSQLANKAGSKASKH